MQVLRTKKRIIVANSNFLEIHKYFDTPREWRKFLEDPRIALPPQLEGKEAVIYILALPQLALEKKHARLSKRLYVPRELLKEISKGSWVAELVIRVSLTSS